MKSLKSHRDYPILFLTARGEEEDMFRGFGFGADDYMVKPFLPRELIYRVTAILRRSYREENPLVKLKHSEIDFARGEVIRNNEHIPLTAKEYEPFSALCRNAGRIVTIAGLTRGYIGNCPAFTAETGTGLMVLGYPPKSFWKYLYPSWDYQLIANSVGIGFSVLVINGHGPRRSAGKRRLSSCMCAKKSCRHSAAEFPD